MANSFPFFSSSPTRAHYFWFLKRNDSFLYLPWCLMKSNLYHYLLPSFPRHTPSSPPTLIFFFLSLSHMTAPFALSFLPYPQVSSCIFFIHFVPVSLLLLLRLLYFLTFQSHRVLGFILHSMSSSIICVFFVHFVPVLRLLLVTHPIFLLSLTQVTSFPILTSGHEGSIRSVFMISSSHGRGHSPLSLSLSPFPPLVLKT